MVEIHFNGKGWVWRLYKNIEDDGSLYAWSTEEFVDKNECMFDYICNRLQDLSKRVRDLEDKLERKD